MAIATQYNVNNYIKGVNGWGLLPTPIKYSVTLGAASEETVTVPSQSAMGGINATTNPRYLAVFSYKPGFAVWVAYNQTAAVPAGATFAATTSELNPNARILEGGDVIHVISASASVDVGIEFYTLQES